MLQTVRPAADSVGLSLRQTDAIVQTDTVSAESHVAELHGQALIAEEPRELNSRHAVSEDVMEQVSGTTEDLLVEEQMSGTTDSAVETTSDLSVVECDGELSVMSALQPAELSELESSGRVQLTNERLDVQHQLSETQADLQLKDAECHELRDAVAQLQQQVAEQSRLLDESRDREDDLQRSVEASQAELRQSDGRWHEVVEVKEQLVMELRADLEALTGSVQRREHMWDNARQSMEEEIELMRLSLAQQTAQYDSQVQVSPHDYW